MFKIKDTDIDEQQAAFALIDFSNLIDALYRNEKMDHDEYNAIQDMIENISECCGLKREEK